MTSPDALRTLADIVEAIDEGGSMPEVDVVDAELLDEDDGMLLGTLDIHAPIGPIEDAIAELDTAPQGESPTADGGTATEPESGPAATADTPAESEWCGRCGAGPFRSVAHHNGHHHSGDPVVLDHAPSQGELVGNEDEDEDEDDGEDAQDVATEPIQSADDSEPGDAEAEGVGATPDTTVSEDSSTAADGGVGLPEGYEAGDFASLVREASSIEDITEPLELGESEVHDLVERYGLGQYLEFSKERWG